MTWQEIIKTDDRYKDFVIFDEPKPFCELFTEDIPVVQTHSTQVYKGIILGFCGTFSWKNHQIKSLDGDSYNEKMLVLGYEWFKTGKKNCLDILVGDDW